MSDRILIMHEGRVSGEVQAADADEENPPHLRLRKDRLTWPRPKRPRWWRPRRRPMRTSFTQMLWQGGTLLALVVLIILFGALQPDAFLSFGNVRNILAQIAILAIIASAQTVVMVVGDFDLSVGVTATLAGATAAALMIEGWSIPLAIVAALVVGTLVAW